MGGMAMNFVCHPKFMLNFITNIIALRSGDFEELTKPCGQDVCPCE